MSNQYEAGPRLVRAIQGVMPYLLTQQDTLHARAQPVPAVYHMPMTEAQRLRREADELDKRDAAINELKAALREDRAVASVRDKLAEDAQERRWS